MMIDHQFNIYSSAFSSAEHLHSAVNQLAADHEYLSRLD